MVSSVFYCKGKEDDNMANNKHLTFDDRMTIEKGLSNGASCKAIGDILNKDKSTILKEIKKHSKIAARNIYGRGHGTYDCIYIKECGHNTYCPTPCEMIKKIPCKRKDKVSGVCNGCESYRTCKLDKKIYEAKSAQKEYESDLHELREGRDITYQEAESLAAIIKPLLIKGQSIGHILSNHSEIPYCEKTIYNFIEDGIFTPFGIDNLTLRLKVKRKMSKKKNLYKKREDRKYLKGRTYEFFEEYTRMHPYLDIVEMDTVYNDVSNGPFIQTFHFVKYDLMIAVCHTERTATAMYDGIKRLHGLLGAELFKKYVAILLTDRGSEFVMAFEIEALGCRIFYCDPMASWQKPHVENNHRLLRCICPKETDLYALGLRSQDDLDLIFSHINSYRRESLHGKSPIQVFKFYYPDSDLLERLGLKEIDPDDITLTPDLIKK